MARDIFNYLGERIGQLDEPTGVSWTEEQWQSALAAYAAPPPSFSYQELKPGSLRKALILSGYTEAAILQAFSELPSPEGDLAKVDWEYKTEFNRTDEVIEKLKQVLAWDESQLETCWRLAATL